LRVAGRPREALELVDVARGLVAVQGREREHALAAWYAAGPLVSLGRSEEARQCLEVALTTLGKTPTLDPGRIQLLTILGHVLITLRDYPRAETSLLEACAGAEALGLHEELGSALDSRATIYAFGGRPQESVALYRLALEVAERHGHRQTAARVSGNLAMTLCLWSLPGAREQCERHLASVRRLGHAFNEAVATHNAMDEDLLEGWWDAAERLGDEARERVPAPLTDGLVGYQLVRLHALRGDSDRAEASLVLLDGFQAVDDPWNEVMRETGSLFAQAARGDAAQVLRHGLELADTAAEKLGVGTETPNLQAWPELLSAALTLGDLEATRQVLDLLATRPPGHLTPGLRAHLARGRALVAGAGGDHDSVEASLRDAIERFRQIKWAYWQAVTELDLAAWMVDQDRPDEAVSPLEDAISVLEPLRAMPALNRAVALHEALAVVGPSAGQRAG